MGRPLSNLEINAISLWEVRLKEWHNLKCQIGTSSSSAIAQVNNFSVATRNLRDFKSTGVALLSPWGD